ncbi:MAG: transglycosylase domain-containing protein, partial [Clostridia bacterium]|nr:transglycosylase domain-containing protein [Clostridia bacterium]
MSDMNDKKDYDLDYFNSHKDDADAASDAVSGNGISDDDAFSLSGFSDNSGLGDDRSFMTDDSGSSDDNVDLSSYGKKQDEIKKESRQKSKKETKNKVKKIILLLLKIFFSIMLIGVITGCLVVGAFAIYVFNFVDDKVYEDLDELALGFTTTIYVEDKASGEFVEYQRMHGEENRIWVDFEQMPEELKNSFVAVEDQRFREHQGVDWKRTVGAFANMFVDLYSSNQGGSTITQQLVKNLTGDNKQTPMRKIREIMRARYLEENYHKDTILECYLNTICLG